jgi:hypothetical protein
MLWIWCLFVLLGRETQIAARFRPEE